MREREREREIVVGNVLQSSVHVRADLWNRQGESEFRSCRVWVKGESGGRERLLGCLRMPSFPSVSSIYTFCFLVDRPIRSVVLMEGLVRGIDLSACICP